MDIVAGLLCAGVGIVFTALGWYLAEQILAFRRTPRQIATVTRVEERVRRDSDGRSVTYRPFFQLADGGPERPSYLMASGYDFDVGTRMEVHVRSGKTEVLMADKAGSIILPGGFVAMGVLVLGIGILKLAGFM